MSELKPCPFCGGEAEISQFGDYRKSTLYSCLECGYKLETNEEFNHGKDWNNRNAKEFKTETRYLPECSEAEALHEILDESYTSTDSVDRECLLCDNCDCTLSGEPKRIKITYKIEAEE